MKSFQPVVLFLALGGCGLVNADRGDEDDSGRSGSGGESGSYTGGQSGNGGSPPSYSHEECVADVIELSGEREFISEVCKQCLPKMQECATDEGCLDLLCNPFVDSECGPGEDCSTARFCIDDALREAGDPALLCTNRTTEQIECGLGQQYACTEDVCFCDFFRPADESECNQNVEFVCVDGERDCFCNPLPDLSTYDCALHEKMLKGWSGIAHECVLACPDGDLSAKECDCFCEPS